MTKFNRFLLLVVLVLAMIQGPFYAQKLYIYDQNTNMPIHEAQVKSCDGQTKLNQTGIEGYVSIIQYAACYLIEAEGYLSRTVGSDEIKANSGKIPMFPNQHSVDEVVVSASKFNEKRKDLAQKVQVISKQELALMNQSSTADVLANSGNVFVQKSQLGGGSPIIRGFETNKVLLVVDGVRMNNAIYRAGHLQNSITIDQFSLEKIEIVNGPSSVLYGSDALGGVIHFYTKSPEFSNSKKILVKGNVASRYATTNNEITNQVSLSVANNKWGSYTSYTQSAFGDLRQGANRSAAMGDLGKRNFYQGRINGKDTMLVNDNPNIQKGSAYQQYDLIQKLVWKL